MKDYDSAKARFFLAISDLVTTNDLDLVRGHQMLRNTPKNIPDTIHVVSWALFLFDMAALPGESSDNFSKNLIFYLNCDVISALR